MKRPEPSSIPLSPGVYLYKDARGKIIYVGKARVLRRRVLSYFRPTGLPAKTAAMISRAQSIEYLATTTEKEALLLEASLIKKYRPHYNIVLRDDKNYSLFKVDLKQDYPRLEITRRIKKDGAKYFGPFTSALAAKETYKLLHRAFALRRCSDRMMKNRVRPCLYHHMGQCPAPCMGLIEPVEYKMSVRKVCELLSGNAGPLLGMMKKEMDKAAESLDFERAAELRDQIKAVEKTVERQAAIMPGATDMDAIGLFEAERGLALGIVFLRNGSVNDRRAFYWAGLGLEDSWEVLSSFLNQFYSQSSPPPRILLPFIPNLENIPNVGSALTYSDEDGGERPDIEDFLETRDMLEQIFSERRGGSVKIIPPQNQSDNQLVDLAQANAREEAKIRQNQDKGAILEKIGAKLGLPGAPRRIECVDVSHISGKQTRVGLVTYIDGQPSKEDYRVYSMPDSSDDYATLYAWAKRRVESGEPWPNLLLIDGGRGQLASVAKGLGETGAEDIFPLAAIAKARDENGHADRRAGNVADRIFLPGRSNPVPFREGSAELLLLQQIRDATHHFAITRHRKARRSAAFSGELMRLPGIGPATARLLWDKFGSVEAMRGAKEEDMIQIPGIGKAKAKMIMEKLAAMS